MRTRIALVAAVPVAVITVSSFTQTASAHSAPTTTTAAHTVRTSASHHPEVVAPGLPFVSNTTALIPRLSPIDAVASRHRRTVRRHTSHPSKSTHVSTKTLPEVPAHTKAIPAAAPTSAPTAAPTLVTTPITAPVTSTTTPTTAPTAPAPTPPVASGPVDTVTPEQRAAWEQVAMCEEGGNWQYDGGSYSGGLGISRANWDAYGGLEFAPEGAAATEDQQIMVAERIQFDPPDRYGCSGW